MAKLFFVNGGGAPVVPTLAAVLAAGNTSGPSDLLMDPTQALDLDAPGVMQIATRALATALALGYIVLPAGTASFQIFINQGGITLHGSGSGVQYSSDVASRAQYRVNQYGANTGVPGISSFKSRALAVGALAPVAAADVIFRATAVGVTGNNSIPLSGMISINVTLVPAGQGYIATEYELQLCSIEGPANNRRPVFKITSQGVPVLRETIAANALTTDVAAGVALLDASGFLLIPNKNVKAGTRFVLAFQDGGTPGPPVGTPYVAARTVGVNFTVASSGLAADAGRFVYWQLWEGI